MKLYEILTEAKKQEPAKPRNFVAKNARATTSGAGAHKDKKKAAKQGYEKHKNKEVAESTVNEVSKDWNEQWRAGQQLADLFNEKYKTGDFTPEDVKKAQALVKITGRAFNVGRGGYRKYTAGNILDDIVNAVREKDVAAGKTPALTRAPTTREMAKQIAAITKGHTAYRNPTTWSTNYGDRYRDAADHVEYDDEAAYNAAWKFIQNKGKQVHYKEGGHLHTAIQIGSYIIEPSSRTMGYFSDNPETTHSISVRTVKSLGGRRQKQDISDEQAAKLQQIARNQNDATLTLLKIIFKTIGEKDAAETIANSEKLSPAEKTKLGKIVASGKKGVAEGSSKSNLQPGTKVMLWLGPRNMLPDPPRDDKKYWDKAEVVSEPEMMTGSWQVLVKSDRKGQSPISPERVFVLKKGVAEGIFDIFKKLPAPGSTVKIAGRPVEITHAGVGSDYIGFAWTDKNGKEHYEETPAEEHDNLRSLAKTIAAEIKYADDDGVDDELDAQIKGRLDRHFGVNEADEWEEEGGKQERFRQYVKDQLHGIENKQQRAQAARQLSQLDRKYFKSAIGRNGLTQTVELILGEPTAAERAAIRSRSQADLEREREFHQGRAAARRQFSYTDSASKEFLAQAEEELLNAETVHELVQIVTALSKQQAKEFHNVSSKVIDTDYGPSTVTQDVLALVKKLGLMDKFAGDRDMEENIQSVDDWKAAVLQAYPQYANKIKFKGRGLQINAEIPGLDRSFGVYDLGSETGEVLHETATAGATSAGNIATVTSPHLAIGGARGNKSYTGSPGKSGTKAPSPPKTLQKKKADGTAVNALDMKNNIFGGGPVKR